MICRSFIVLIILFAGYTAYINNRPGLSVSQHQWQDNNIRAENYIYAEPDSFRHVIIGSSLASRLNMDSLPGYFNLSFGGQSIFDGLGIIRSSNKIPKTILIETNIFIKKEKDGFAQSFFEPLGYYGKKFFLSLRSDKQPLSILVLYMSHYGRKTTKRIMNGLSFSSREQKVTETLKVKDESRVEVPRSILELQKEKYATAPDSVLLQEQLALLKGYCDYFSKKGIQVIFFEMPVDKEIKNLTYPRVIRNAIQAFASTERIPILPMDSTDYPTTDGVHLNVEEANRFSGFVKHQLLYNYR